MPGVGPLLVQSSMNKTCEHSGVRQAHNISRHKLDMFKVESGCHLHSHETAGSYTHRHGVPSCFLFCCLRKAQAQLKWTPSWVCGLMGTLNGLEKRWANQVIPSDTRCYPVTSQLPTISSLDFYDTGSGFRSNYSNILRF